MTSSLPKLNIAQYTGHDESVGTLALGSFSTPFHNTIASGGNDGKINFYDARIPSHEGKTQSYTNSIQTDASINSIVFGEPILPRHTTHLTLDLEEDDRTTRLAVNQSLFEQGQYSLFAAANNLIYQYDLRKLQPASASTINSSESFVSLHVALSNGFPEDVGCLTLSPDGQMIAAADDNGNIYYIPLSHNLTLSRCLSNELSTFNPPSHTFSQVHANIPTGIVYDPFSPLSIISAGVHTAPLYASFTTGMDYAINTLALPPTCQQQYTLLHNNPDFSSPQQQEMIDNIDIAPLQQLMVNELTVTESALHAKKDGRQAFNPPFINASILSPDNSTLLCALGDGQLALYALERETPFASYAVLPKGANKNVKGASAEQQMLDYLKYLDVSTEIYTSHRALTPFTTRIPTNIGRYRGHTHSVVGVNIPAFLYSSITSTVSTKLWLSQLQQRLYANQSDKTGVNNTKYTFSSLFNKTVSSNNIEFYTNQEHQSLSAQLRHMFSQQYKPYPTTAATSAGTVNKKPKGNNNKPHSFNRDFSSFDHVLTCGLDMSLVMWKDIGVESGFIYDVSRQQQHLAETQQEQLMLNDKKIPHSQRIVLQQRLKQHKEMLEQQKKLISARYTKFIEEVLNDSVQTIENEVETEQKVIDNDFNEVYNFYTQSLLSVHKEYTKNRVENENLLSGMYKRLLDNEKDWLDVNHMQLRVPLASKPNAMITDRIGNVYIADGTKKITVINLLKE